MRQFHSFLCSLVILSASALRLHAAGEIVRVVAFGERVEIPDATGRTATLTVNSVQSSTVAVQFKTRFMNETVETGALAAATGSYRLPDGTVTSGGSGSARTCAVPRKGGAKEHERRSCIPLFQTPDGTRLYLVDTLDVAQNHWKLLIEPAAAPPATVRR